jgi:radical SAM protein (TIGR01212 family)
MELVHHNEKCVFRYNHFSSYLKSKFGYAVHKVTIDAGFTCPNRDGTIGYGGCIYCDNRAFNLNVRRGLKESPRQQIKDGIAQVKEKFGIDKIIAYFQAYSNTYGDVACLKEQYDVIRDFPEIVGLAIGTRPDCVDQEKLDLVESYSKDYMVWIEYGLQSANNETLKRINRGHTVEQFLKAVEMTKERNISICVHLILGLPGENHSMMMDTAQFLSGLPIRGIKLHNQCVIRQTILEKMYRDGDYRPLTLEEYVKAAVDFLERIPFEVTVQRLTADAPDDIFVAPDWAKNRWKIIEEIDKDFVRRDSHQGIGCCHG